MMRRMCAGMLALSLSALAQGTKQWTIDQYSDFARGKTEGVAIRSDGRLEPGPATSLLHATSSNYVWSIAADSAGNSYAGLGGTQAGSGVVMKISPEGKPTKFFESKELGVQALLTLPDGSVLAATSPNGKLYRIPADGGAATVLFDPATTPEKPKYLWNLAVIGDTVFVAAGAPAVVYRVPLHGDSPTVLFQTADQHIRCLLAGTHGTLWAGSDGSGVIYRINTNDPAAKPFAVYAAPKREITSLAMDAAGNIYAAGVGTKTGPALPPLPVTGNVGVTITFSQPRSSTAASTNSIIPDGSEVYRIAPDGAPSRLLELKDDVVYALTVRNGALLAATGNRGRVYRIDTEVPGRFTDVAHLEAAQGMAFAALKDSLAIATSNSGKIFKLRDRLTSPAIYTSEVFDAQQFSRWGHADVRSSARASVDLYARSGNVESPLMGWSDWIRVAPDSATLGVPEARFAQWKAILREGGSLDAVTLNYLQKNIAPVVDEIAVQPGARMPESNGQQPANTVQINLPSPSASSPVVSLQSSTSSTPLTAQKDKSAVTVRWAAHDDNGDNMMFAVYERGQGETNWHLLKDKITDSYYSFDASLLPDGRYTVRIVASDAPAHTDADTLTGEKTSESFVIDTTPPVPGALTATIENRKIHVTLEVKDATSPIAHAEYSIDAQPWQYVEPVGALSDERAERYDFLAPVPTVTNGVTDPKEHIVAMRIYDRFDNVVSVKTVVP